MQHDQHDHKVERIAEGAGFWLGILGVLIFAAWSRSLFSILYAAVAVPLILMSFLRWHKLSKLSDKERQELIRRQDEAMLKSSRDDPKEMARWVP